MLSLRVTPAATGNRAFGDLPDDVVHGMSTRAPHDQFDWKESIAGSDESTRFETHLGLLRRRVDQEPR